MQMRTRTGRTRTARMRMRMRTSSPQALSMAAGSQAVFSSPRNTRCTSSALFPTFRSTWGGEGVEGM